MRIVKGARDTGSDKDRGLTHWLVAALLAGAALVGLLVIFIVVFVSLQEPPPQWVQVGVGAGLVVGATLFAWLLASALSSGQAAKSAPARSAPQESSARSKGSRDDEGGARTFSEVS
jgi:protein-S-isoprenylcysteine O-methyltransferase Ste14